MLPTGADERKGSQVSMALMGDIPFTWIRAVHPVFFAEGYSIHGSASIGIALYPEDGETKDTILSAADAAMYVNKKVRRGK